MEESKNHSLLTSESDMSSKGVTHVFHPFRAIGQFCDAVPFAIQKQGRTYFVASSIDKTFQVYNVRLFNSKQIIRLY